MCFKSSEMNYSEILKIFENFHNNINIIKIKIINEIK